MDEACVSGCDAFGGWVTAEPEKKKESVHRLPCGGVLAAVGRENRGKAKLTRDRRLCSWCGITNGRASL